MAIPVAEPIVRMRNIWFRDVKLGKIFSCSWCSCVFFSVTFFIVFLVKHLFEKLLFPFLISCVKLSFKNVLEMLLLAQLGILHLGLSL